jgi:serine/threonine protein kinase
VKQLQLNQNFGMDMEDPDNQAKEDLPDMENLIKVFEEFRREASLISSLQHTNIVQFKGVVMEPFAIVLEYMPLGTLYDFIFENRFEVISETAAISLALDIANGMAFIHMHRFIFI